VFISPPSPEVPPAASEISYATGPAPLRATAATNPTRQLQPVMPPSSGITVPVR
jgi:hypothetical protein